MRCSGSPVTTVYSVRCACGAWVVHQTVRRPLTGSWSAIAPHVSIGAGCERGNTMSCSTTTAARSKAAAVASASPVSQSKARLLRPASRSSRITGASGSSARRAFTTAGSGSYSTSISSSASRAA